MYAASLASVLARHGLHYGWVMAGLTFLTVLSSAAAVSVPGVLIVPLTAELGWTRSEISAAIALMFVLFGGIAPFAGALMARYGLRRVAAAAAAVAAVALAGASRMTETWHLWLCLGLLLGLAAGATAMVLSATVASRWFTRRRGLVMGMLAAGTATGQLVFLPLAAWLVGEAGWRLAMLPAMAACALSAVLYFLFARDWPSDVGLPPYGEATVQPPAAGTAGNAAALAFVVLRGVAGRPVFWLLAGTFFVCGLSSSGIVQQHFIPFCADRGVDGVRAASILATMGLFNFAGTVASGWLSDRFDNRLLLAAYYGLRGLSLLWLPFGRFDLVSLALFAVFFGLDFIATVPPTVRLSVQHFGAQAGPIVFGWAFASHQLGSAVAALGAGLVRDTLLAYDPAFLAAGVACLAAVAGLLAMRDVGAARPAPTPA